MNSNLHIIKEAKNTTDLNGWKYVGHFGANSIYAKGNIRRIIEPETSNVVVQYQFNQIGEAETNARM
jgi:hypothetical protein